MELQKIKRLVVKVGTSTLTYDNGKLNLRRMEKLARALADLKNRGFDVVLVSSGAIGVGTGKLNLPARPESVRGKQAVAAIGQCELMSMYDKLFAEYCQIVSQILLTKADLETNRKKSNCTNTFDQLLEYGAIPIVNENDTVATEEIEFGDNDTLSALVAKLIGADLLILLSDIDGLYDSDPHQNPQAKLIPVVHEITDEIRGNAGGAGTRRGTGGMITKLNAAQIATEAGCNMIIANGEDPDILFDIFEGNFRGTLFTAK